MLMEEKKKLTLNNYIDKELPKGVQKKHRDFNIVALLYELRRRTVAGDLIEPLEEQEAIEKQITQTRTVMDVSKLYGTRENNTKDLISQISEAFLKDLESYINTRGKTTEILKAIIRSGREPIYFYSIVIHSLAEELKKLERSNAKELLINRTTLQIGIVNRLKNFIEMTNYDLRQKQQQEITYEAPVKGRRRKEKEEETTEEEDAADNTLNSLAEDLMVIMEEVEILVKNKDNDVDQRQRLIELVQPKVRRY